MTPQLFKITRIKHAKEFTYSMTIDISTESTLEIRITKADFDTLASFSKEGLKAASVNGISCFSYYF